ncbi:creatininase family protein [Aminobacter aganoensis]|uniref:Creatinine amidohydrolase n=1 Tax=Aminobacter aganoensis TaxID=83264 RepID=A0A7X0FE75_9HYPH|nr:creatininase family protein [Aminobacter aganoensis]MBB6357803.1 creatinine amidohydrolase [Aminobacter aganoensis]
MELIFSTWNEVEAYLDRSKGIVIPLGSIEQHGPNGLIGTDALCAEAIARRMASEGEILVGPTISFGVAPFNLAFPGTISVRSTTLMALVTDYVRSLAKHGFEHFYFLNGHGGNLGPLRAACQDLQAERSYGEDGGQRSIRFFFRSWWEFPTVDTLRREFYDDGEGMHATPSEIAVTQALFPEHVKAAPPTNVARLSTSYLREHAGDNHADAHQHRQHFPDGRVGSESGLATPQQGLMLLDAAISDGICDYKSFLESF